MKLPELRKQIETYSIEELRCLTAELYKAIPQKVKEEKDIDSLILSVPEYIKGNKTVRGSSPAAQKKGRSLKLCSQKLSFFLKMPTHKIILSQTVSSQSTSAPSGVLK